MVTPESLHTDATPHADPALGTDAPPEHLDQLAEAAELRLAVFRLARRLRAERGDSPLSDPQQLVLGALHHVGPMSLGELAAHERVSAPSMNRTVNCLEEQGFVTREADDADGRRVSVQITAAGQALIEDVKRRRTTWLALAMHELTEAEHQQLVAATPLLHRLAAL